MNVNTICTRDAQTLEMLILLGVCCGIGWKLGARATDTGQMEGVLGRMWIFRGGDAAGEGAVGCLG